MRSPASASGEGEDVRPLPVEALELEAEPTIALRRAGLDHDRRSRGPADGRLRRALRHGGGDRRCAACSATRRGRSIRAAIRRRSSSSAASPSRSPGPTTRSRSSANWSPKRRWSWRARGEGGRAFAATLFRCDGLAPRLTIETGRPSRDPALIVRLLRERIDALADPLDPGFGYDMVRLGGAAHRAAVGRPARNGRQGAAGRGSRRLARPARRPPRARTR